MFVKQLPIRFNDKFPPKRYPSVSFALPPSEFTISKLLNERTHHIGKPPDLEVDDKLMQNRKNN